MTNRYHITGLLEPLKIALDLELEGKRFFSEAASTVTGDTARHTFEFLAAEEDRHIQRIREFYQSLEHAGEDDLPEVDESHAERRLSEFNDHLASLKTSIRPTLSDIEAYRTALKFENGAKDFYAHQSRLASNPQVRLFFRWLISEEAIHSQVLESCIRFAEDPAGWFRFRTSTSE